MKWLKNLESIAKNNSSGVCPCCGSTNTAYNAVEIKRGMGYMIIWCDECKNAVHISRVKINDMMITNKTIPNGLVF